MLRAGDVLDDTKQVRCTQCGNQFEIEGRHAAPACPQCGGEQFEEQS